MKRSVVLGAVIALALVVAGILPAVLLSSPTTSASGWVFPGPGERMLTVAEAFSGRYDDHVATLEGQITNVVNQPWMQYNFVDSTGTIMINFEDDVPPAAVIRNTTVRIKGEVDNGEVKVAGLQTLGNVSIGPSTTVSRILNGEHNEQSVVVKGQLGNRTDEWWNIYDFSDGTGKVDADLENETSWPQNRTLLLFGEAKRDWGKWKIDADLVLVANFGQPAPTATPTSAPPTATPTPPGPAPTATPTRPVGEDLWVYMPLTFKPGAPTPVPPTPDPGSWVWTGVTPVSRILSGAYDDRVAVIEGRITGRAPGFPTFWQYFNFTDGTGTLILDFEDEIPTNVIPINSTVRLIGDVEMNNGVRKHDVYGLQTLSTSPARWSHTAAQVNSGSLEDQEVSIKGRIGDLVYDAWKLYKFSDQSGTTEVDLENKLTRAQVPQNRTLIIYGQVDENWGEYQVDSRLMLVARSYGN